MRLSKTLSDILRNDADFGKGGVEVSLKISIKRFVFCPQTMICQSQIFIGQRIDVG